MSDGRTIAGKYQLLGELGAGGMATVHLAMASGPSSFRKLVVVKQIRADVAEDPNFVAMFLDEARVAARLSHPNVVSTFEVGEERGRHFLAMEYVDGASFHAVRSRVAKAPKEAPLFELRHALRVLADALLGLHAAHTLVDYDGRALHVVHRDVSPHNLLIAFDGTTKIADFGIAKAADSVVQTQDGALKGKVVYMAPEQAQGGVIDHRADLYAVGVMLYEAAIGERRFPGVPNHAILGKLFSDEPAPAPFSRAHRLPSAFDAVVAKALAPRPDDRFQDALSFREAIEGLLRELGTPTPAYEVGRVLEALFSSDRKKRRQVVEAHMVAVRAAEEAGQSMPGPLLLEALRGTISAVDSRDLPPPSLDRSVPSSRSVTLSSGHTAPSAPTPAIALSMPPAGPKSAEPPGPARATEPVRVSGALKEVLLVSGVMLVLGGAVSGYIFLKKQEKSRIRSVASAAPSVAASTQGHDANAIGAAPAAACPEGMIAIPGGSFFQGSDSGQSAEKPAHHVDLAPFCIDRFEVTTAAYKACSDGGNCQPAATDVAWTGITAKETKAFGSVCNARDPAARGTHPINCVDHRAAQNYCARIGARLPTEAEWEFAARGPDGRTYPWGNEPPDGHHLNACGKECAAWGVTVGQAMPAMYTDDDGFAATAPVGSFPKGASRYGVEDVVGNVWEWTADFYGPYTDADAKNPKGAADGKERVIRGGAFNGGFASWVRPTQRYSFDPAARSHAIGFRCAKDRLP